MVRVGRDLKDQDYMPHVEVITCRFQKQPPKNASPKLLFPSMYHLFNFIVYDFCSSMRVFLFFI